MIKTKTAKKKSKTSKPKEPKFERGKKFSHRQFRFFVRYCEKHVGFPERVARKMEKIDPGHVYYRQEVRSWLKEGGRHKSQRVEPRYGIGCVLLMACKAVLGDDSKKELTKARDWRTKQKSTYDDSEVPH